MVKSSLPLVPVRHYDNHVLTFHPATRNYPLRRNRERNGLWPVGDCTISPTPNDKHSRWKCVVVDKAILNDTAFTTMDENDYLFKIRGTSGSRTHNSRPTIGNTFIILANVKRNNRISMERNSNSVPLPDQPGDTCISASSSPISTTRVKRPIWTG